VQAGGQVHRHRPGSRCRYHDGCRELRH
jgi:hypothetical protein